MGDAFNLLGAQRAVFNSGLTTAQKITALALLDHWSASAKTFPSVSTIANKTGLGPSTVKAAIKALEQTGCLRVVRDFGSSNKYELTGLMHLPEAKRQAHPPRPNRASSKTSPGGRPVQEVDPTGPGGRRPPVQELDPKEPIEGTQEGTQPSAPKTARVRGSSRSKKPNGDDRLPHPNTQLLKNHYIQVFKQSRGKEPDWTPSDHGRVGKAFRLLADAFNGDLAVQKQVISTALLDEFAPVTDPRVIHNRRDQFVGQEPRRKGSGAKPYVQSHGHLVTVNREGF